MNLNKGFSLLEVLVALAIMVVAFTTLIGTQSGHLLISERGENMTTAVLLAREKMAQIELDYRRGLPNTDLEEIKTASDKPFGDDFPDFGYTLTIKKVLVPIPQFGGEDGEEASPDAAASADTLSQIISQAIREIRLKVTWESAGGPDEIEIVTHLVDLNANIGIL